MEQKQIEQKQIEAQLERCLNDEKKKQTEILYFEKVDLVFQTLAKALRESLSFVTDYLHTDYSVAGANTDKALQTVIFLHNQLKSCENFLGEYSKLKEEV